MFDGVSRPTARGLWMLAIAIVAVEIAFAAMLVWANTVAEQVRGERIEQVALADAGLALPRDLADDAFRQVSLPAQDCCATTPLVARITLPPEAMQLADPALLIVSVHDNMLVYIDGQLAAGSGAQDHVSLTGRRPHLVRLPKALLHEGARIDLVIQRAIGFGHLRPFYIGEHEGLRPSYLALRLLRSDLPYATGVLGALVAVFCLCAAPLFGARGLLLSLSGLAVGWTLQQVQMLMTDPPWGAVAHACVYLVGVLATVMFLFWFFVEWTSVFAADEAPKRGRLARVLIGPWSNADRRRLGLGTVAAVVLGGALVTTVIFLRADQMEAIQDMDRVLGWLGLLVLPLCLIRIVAYYWRMGLRNPIEASAFIFVIIAAIGDILMVRVFQTYGVFLDTAATFFPLALLLSLAARAQGIFEAATANAAKLADMVARREETILANVEQLREREREATMLQERTRIMRDMHDGLGSQLLGLLLQARSNKIGHDALVRGIETSLDDLRLVVDSLDMKAGSLSEALGEFRRRMEPRLEAAGVALVWRVQDVEETPAIGPGAMLQVFRILQEACSNALRHASPQTIEVSLARDDAGVLVVSVADNGSGFDVATTGAGRGMASMRARASRIGGQLEVVSAPGDTRVSLVLPASSGPS
jgi:two-component system, NarL family, sensor histidine kinase UhpB